MIDVVIHIDDGIANVKVDMQKANNADLQAIISNLELIKMNMLRNLASMSEGQMSHGDDTELLN